MSANVRVRFAPSPTGYLHVGGARTAIFNWLFARGAGGTFVLRIEDTDVERSTAQSEASLLEDLRWLGLDWDEGPDCGGGSGPYRQSERTGIYREHAHRLIDAGVAYPCFCSDADLQAKKERATREGRPPHYDGTCRGLSAGEVEARRAGQLSEVIRFRVPDGEVRFADRVRGIVEMPTSMVGDFVLVRSNGRPTYNFAATVDDHTMRITHVLRGEEHLPNTLRQILVYRAFGAELPTFGHLPLILAEDRSKLSKRHGSSSVDELRAAGFLPDAVVNYLVLLGWSHPQAKEILERDEMRASFTLDRINKSAAVYDPVKLKWMNGQYIRALDANELFPLADRFFPDDIREAYDETDRRTLFGLLHDSVERLDELPDACAPFRKQPEYEDEARDVLASQEAQTVVVALAEQLREEDATLTADTFKKMMKAVGKATGVKGKALFFPVRAAVTGSVHGPDLASIAELRGRESLVELLERARVSGG